MAGPCPTGIPEPAVPEVGISRTSSPRHQPRSPTLVSCVERIECLAKNVSVQKLEHLNRTGMNPFGLPSDPETPQPYYDCKLLPLTFIALFVGPSSQPADLMEEGNGTGPRGENDVIAAAGERAHVLSARLARLELLVGAQADMLSQQTVMLQAILAR